MVVVVVMKVNKFIISTTALPQYSRNTGRVDRVIGILDRKLLVFH